MPIKIRGIPYNQLSIQDDSKINGDTFSSNSPFMIICNKPIPKNYKTYMEFTITEHPNNSMYRHLPLYVGLHKEPSFGILNSDFIIGTVYYTLSNMNYDIMERYNAAGNPIHQNVSKTHAKIPILNTVIGIGADIPNNKINIYSDGSLFYSFSPTTFNLSNETEDFYFVIYSKFNERIKGNVNYGRYKTNYMPEGYWNLYQYYYTHSESYQEITGTITVPGTIYNKYSYKEVTIKSDIVNTIAPLEEDNKKHIRFVYTKDSNKYESDQSFKFSYHPGTIPEIIDIVSTNLPIPVDTNVYIEFNIKECEMNSNFTGIPVEIGITEEQNNLNKAFGVNLFHEIYKRYKYHSYNNETINEYDIRTISNPVTPMQPDRIGVLIELKNNRITVYTDNSEFFSVNFKDISFNNPTGLYYFFIRAANSSVYNYEYYGICNFGEEKPDFDLPPNSTTLFNYYNDPIKFPIDSIFINCRINAKAYKTFFNKFIYCSFNVPESSSSNPLDFSPGLNKLWNTYNIITDKEYKNNVPDKNAFELDDIIKEDLKNNDRRIWIIYLLESKIIVREGDPVEFSKFILSGEVIGRDYIMYNNNNLLEGRITGIRQFLLSKNILDSQIELIRTELNRDNILPGYIDNIRVFNYEDEYNNGIILDCNVQMHDYQKYEGDNTTISSTINNLNTENYIKYLDSNITISNLALNKFIESDLYMVVNHTVTIIQSNNQIIKVSCNGKEYTESFETEHGSNYTVTIEASPGYNPGILSSTEGFVNDDITISATAASKNNYLVTITQSANQTIEVVCNGKTYTSSFTASYGSKYTARVVPSAGYNAGTISSASGTITNNITISATPATIKQFTVTITQSSNQTIKVVCNGQTYTSTFKANYGSTYTATITPNTGYNAGTLNHTSGTITDNISISATAATLKQFTVTINQSANQTIKVVCNGQTYTSAFKANYGSTYTATVTPNTGYNAGTISSVSGTITGNITISATSAVIKQFTVTITQSANQTITVKCNGQSHTSSFKANYGSTYTASVSVSNSVYYSPGTISSASGTITNNITISATPATLKRYTITVTQPANGKITVNGTVGTSFTFNAGTSVTVQATANSGYKVAALNVDKVTKTLSTNIEEEN